MSRSYPYPFLDQSDDVVAQFKVDGDPSISLGGESIDITIPVLLSKSVREKLIESGQSHIVANWYCSTTIQAGSAVTSLQKVFRDNATISFQIPRESVIGSVTVEVVMLAREPIESLQWPEVNPLYSGYKFSVSENTILGAAPRISFEIPPAYDPASADQSSIFRIRRSANPDHNVVSYNLDTNNIVVEIPERTFDQMTNLAGIRSISFAAIIVPVLAQVLQELSLEQTDSEAESGSSEYADRSWYKSLVSLLHNNNLDLEEPFITAQLLMDSPTISLFEELNNHMIDEDLADE